MNILKTLSLIAVLGAALAAAAPAAAITYVGSRDVGVGRVDLSITTDDTLGVLSLGNILDWSVHVTNSVESHDLFGPLSGNNSLVGLAGTALIASATELTFDFDGDGAFAFLTEFSPAVRGWCVDGAAATFPTPTCVTGSGSEYVLFGVPSPGSIRVAREGVQVLATAQAVAPVPEPATWALMIAGFGLAGGELRRRRSGRAAAI